MSETNYKLYQCYNCGNKGLMEMRYRTEHKYGGPVFDEFENEIGYDLEEWYEWQFLSCPVCHKPTLIQIYSEEQTDFSTEEVLYPPTSVNYRGVPKAIRAAFEAALKVKNIDADICLLSLRRTLEAICKEQGASGKTLENMTKDLLDKGKLPPSLDDACWIIRKLGNRAAHADAEDIAPYELDQTIEFLETIMKYLYTLPAQMKRLKERISKKETEVDVDADA